MPSVALQYPLAGTVPWTFKACGTYDTAPSVVIPPDAAAGGKAADVVYQVKVTASNAGGDNQERYSDVLVASNTTRSWSTKDGDDFVFTANHTAVKFKAELLGTTATAEKTADVSKYGITDPNPCAGTGGQTVAAGKGAKAAVEPTSFFYKEGFATDPEVVNVVYAIVRRNDMSPDSAAEYLSITTADHRETKGSEGTRFHARLLNPVREAKWSYFLLTYSLDARDHVLGVGVQLL